MDNFSIKLSAAKYVAIVSICGVVCHHQNHLARVLNGIQLFFLKNWSWESICIGCAISLSSSFVTIFHAFCCCCCMLLNVNSWKLEMGKGNSVFFQNVSASNWFNASQQQQTRLAYSEATERKDPVSDLWNTHYSWGNAKFKLTKCARERKVRKAMPKTRWFLHFVFINAAFMTSGWIRKPLDLEPLFSCIWIITQDSRWFFQSSLLSKANIFWTLKHNA